MLSLSLNWEFQLNPCRANRYTQTQNGYNQNQYSKINLNILNQLRNGGSTLIIKMGLLLFFTFIFKIDLKAMKILGVLFKNLRQKQSMGTLNVFQLQNNSIHIWKDSCSYNRLLGLMDTLNYFFRHIQTANWIKITR